MTNNKDTERFIVDCKDDREARQWVINHVDLSKDWNITEDKKIIKQSYIVWLDKVGRNVNNYNEAKKLYNKWISLNYDNVRLEIIEENI
jgi:hypothetical protein